MSEILSASTAARRDPQGSLCDANSETFPSTSGECAAFRRFIKAGRDRCKLALPGLPPRVQPVCRANLRLPSNTRRW